MKPIIFIGDNPPYVISHPCDALSKWSQLKFSEKPIDYSMIIIGTSSTNFLIAEIEDRNLELSSVGDEGYVIKTVHHRGREHIIVAGNTIRGTMYGIYGFLRELRMANIRDPFQKEWNIKSKPDFPIRAVYVNPFPAAIRNFTTDTWSIEQWKEYIDGLCMAGANQIQIAIWQCRQGYHPESNYTDPKYSTLGLSSKMLWNIWREMIRYAHKMGMEAYVGFTYNEVDMKYYAEHADVKAFNPIYGEDRFGLLCWSKGKKEIINYMSFLIEYFREADGFVIWLLDPGDCFCKRCNENKTAIIIDAVKTYGRIIRRHNPNAKIALNLWPIWAIPLKYDRFDVDAILDGIPRDTIIIDKPDTSLDNVKRASSRGFRSMAFIFEFDPEGLIPWPKPQPDVVNRYVYMLPSLGADGMLIYRITALTQFMNDYYALRKLWNKDITFEEACIELASLLCDDAEARDKVSLGLKRLGEWSSWSSDIDSIDAARTLFSEAYEIEPKPKIGILRDCTRLLYHIGMVKAGSDADRQFEKFWNEMRQIDMFQPYIAEGKEKVRNEFINSWLSAF